MAAPAQPKPRSRGEYRKTRGQLFRALPKHLAWAAAMGLVGGLLLHVLKDIHLSGMWDLLMFIPLAVVHVNMAVLPVVIPGRHWSFGYIGAVMLFFLLIAGTVLAGKIEFPHARGTGNVVLVGVNVVTYWALLTGSLLGLLYGLIAGRTGAMVMGLMLGSLAGYGLGIGYASFFELGPSPVGELTGVRVMSMSVEPEWVGTMFGVAIALSVLHVMSLTGAALGADRE